MSTNQEDFNAFADLLRDFSLFGPILIRVGTMANAAGVVTGRVSQRIFEREQLYTSDSEDDAMPAHRCSLAQDNLRVFRSKNTDLGEGLMSLLENAEAVASEKDCEGYYLTTCQQLKVLHEHRMAMDRSFNDVVAHHQRIHNSCNAHHSVRQNLDSEVLRLNNEVRASRLRNSDLTNELEALRSRINMEGNWQSRLECLKAQYDSRIKGIKATHEAEMKAKNDVISSDVGTIAGLQAEIRELRRKQQSSRNVVAFLNKRLRQIVKSVRTKGQAAAHPICHILGTYSDILGAPV